MAAGLPQHYLQRALRAQVYDVAKRTPLDPAPKTLAGGGMVPFCIMC